MCAFNVPAVFYLLAHCQDLIGSLSYFPPRGVQRALPTLIGGMCIPFCLVGMSFYSTLLSHGTYHLVLGG